MIFMWGFIIVGEIFIFGENFIIFWWKIINFGAGFIYYPLKNSVYLAGNRNSDSELAENSVAVGNLKN